jgi:hypothetical protein
VVSYLSLTPNTITYVALDVAMERGLRYASLINRAGVTVRASPSSILPAATSVSLSYDWTASLVDAAAPSAWPIVTYSYVIIRLRTLHNGGTCSQRSELVKFWQWFWTSSTNDALLLEFGFAAIPITLQSGVAKRLINNVLCNDGQPALPANRVITIRGEGSPLPATLYQLSMISYAQSSVALVINDTTDVVYEYLPTTSLRGVADVGTGDAAFSTTLNIAPSSLGK